MSITDTDRGLAAGARSFAPETAKRAKAAVTKATKQAKAAASAASDTASAFYDDALDRAKAAQAMVDTFVGERPYSALALVAVAGIVLGALFFASGPKVYYLKPSKD